MKVGLIGCGKWGREWARVLSRMGVLHWMCDSDPAAFEQKWNGVEQHVMTVVTNTPAVVLEAYPVDVVVIATPPDTHYDVFCEVVNAECALRGVMVEKPMAIYPADALLMHEYAYATGLTLSVGHTFTHVPVWKAALEASPSICSRHFEAEWANPSGHAPESAAQAGLLWDLGPHPLSVMLQMAPPNLPDEVWASARSICTHRDMVHFSLAWMDDKFTADVRLSSVGAGKRRYIRATDSEGVTECWPTHPEVWRAQHGKLTRAVPHERGMLEPLALQAKWFLDEVERGRPGNSRDGARVVEILYMVQEALG